MSVVTIVKKPVVKVTELEAILFATIGQRATIVDWVSAAGDEDVIFRHNPGPEGTPEDDESYILIAGDDLTARLFVGQWLVRFPGDDFNVYVAYSVEEFNRDFDILDDATRNLNGNTNS